MTDMTWLDELRPGGDDTANMPCAEQYYQGFDEAISQVAARLRSPDVLDDGLRERIEALRPWPEGERLIRSLLRLEASTSAALARSESPSPDTTTHCPMHGVHEHAFRGPHVFREWEPGEPRESPAEDQLAAVEDNIMSYYDDSGSDAFNHDRYRDDIIAALRSDAHRAVRDAIRAALRRFESPSSAPPSSTWPQQRARLESFVHQLAPTRTLPQADHMKLIQLVDELIEAVREEERGA